MDTITFKVKCITETEMHQVDKIYKAIAYFKPNGYIYVEDERNYQMISFKNFYDFFKYFKIINDLLW